MLLATLSKSTAWSLFGIGIAGLVVGILATLFLFKFKKRKKIEKESFDLTPGKYKFFRFWQYYGIIILALTGYIMFVIFVPLSLEVILK
ncbi:hypothetical protein SLITO_v1c08950 [Spiroplasma litorale]|uniref:Uncharacterized protein n=1 Tax=Spiroplasma litorale TaxID=216942 RepID=A0A0K1W2E9_9MOLU|nr:hypothetical protein [Spiroplasma litorale]AKX34509.1 hypothetical protein SLITO_v1c08950 [Spiroplasma litorale]